MSVELVHNKVAHTAEKYGLRPEAKHFPMMLVLSFVYPCNAECPHCPYTIHTRSIQVRAAGDVQPAIRGVYRAARVRLARSDAAAAGLVVGSLSGGVISGTAVG